MKDNFDYVIDLFLKNMQKYRAINPKYTDAIPQVVQDHISDIKSKTIDNEKRVFIKKTLKEFRVKNFEGSDKAKYEELFKFYRDVVSKIVVLEGNLDFEQQRNNSIEDKNYTDKSGNPIFKTELKHTCIEIIFMHCSYEDLKKSKCIKKEMSITSKKIEGTQYTLKAKHELGRDRWKSNTAAVKKYKQNALICPYCNISYLNYSEGYSELDHIYPHSIYPMLKYSPINLVSCCGSCNNKKSDIVINFTIDDLISLHKNKFSKERLEIKCFGNLKEMKELLDSVNDICFYDRDDYFELLKVETFLYSKDEKFEKLNISARYNTLKPILIRISKKFYENERNIRDIITVHKTEIHDDNYEYIFKEQLFINIFDEWHTNAIIEREQMEVILYFRLEYIKHLIKQYI